MQIKANGASIMKWLGLLVIAWLAYPNGETQGQAKDLKDSFRVVNNI